MLPRPFLLLPLTLLFGAFILSACGGDDDSGRAGASADGSATVADTTPTERGGGADDREPDLGSPASRFAPLKDDLGDNFFADLKGTGTLSMADYAASAIFTSPGEGEELLVEWGYVDGYRVAFQPSGGTDTVLQSGRYYANIEVHLFDDGDGAGAFLDHVEERLSSGNAQRLDGAPALANGSSAWEGFDTAPVPGSDIPAVFDWYLFRRGNLAAIVRTWGAAPFMTVEPAYDLATIIDEKALGERSAVEPTPSQRDTTATETATP